MTGAEENLGTGAPLYQQNADHTSRYHRTAFLDQPYSSSLLGKYWCQVINTTADPDQPLMRSNVFTLLAPANYSGEMCTEVQQIVNKTCADLPLAQTTSLVITAKQATLPVQTTTLDLLLTSTNNILVVPKLIKTTMISSDSTLLYTSYSTGQHLISFTLLKCTSFYHLTHAVDYMIISSHPSPTESAPVMQSLTPIIAGVSAGVVLVLISCSLLIVILIIMNRRKKQDKQQTQTGKNTCIQYNTDVCIDMNIICVGSYSNNAVSYNICSEPEDTVNFQ